METTSEADRRECSVEWYVALSCFPISDGS